MIKNIAIVGYGNIARKHIEVFRALGCRVEAVCNRSRENRELAQRQDDIPSVFEDVHEMIQKVKPEGILVCVSYWNMYPVLKEIIPYGIPILSEKPTGTSLEEHLKLLALAEKYDTSVMVGLNRRHYSVLQQALEIAGGKEQITSVLIEWSEDPIRLLDQKGYTEEQVKKIIFGNSIHGLDLLNYLGGPIQDPKIHFHSAGPRFRWQMNLSGISARGTIINFNSNWDNFIPWRVVFTAANRRFILAPLETCRYYEGKNRTEVIIKPSKFDQDYKPGFFTQAKIYVEQKFSCSDCGLSSVNQSMALADKLRTRTQR